MTQETTAGADEAAIDLDLLLETAHAMGLSRWLDSRALEAYARYAEALTAANQRLNLTRINGPRDMAVLHLLDSLVCLRGLGPDLAPEEPLRLVDVGSGPGLPGLALKIARPHWRLTLVESVGKKAAFLRGLVALPELGLAGTTVLAARAEDAARLAEHRGVYDLATARAVATLPVLAEYLLPFLRVGGRALALKGAEAAAEARSAAGAIARLGGELLAVEPYALPGLDQPRHLVVIVKRHPTAPAYPRRAGLPVARPLA